MVKRSPQTGIDLVEVSRFTRLVRNKKDPFLLKVFSTEEREYAFSFADPAVHLAGAFAAKEAASKALGVARYPYITLHVRHRKDGAPEIWHKGKRLKMAISITHTATMAAAVAVV